MPIVERELRVLARRRETYSIRVRIALAATVGGIGAMVAYNYFGGAWTGFTLFQGLTEILFALCMFGGAHVAHDCLSEEKREGTLGLLFLTDLTGHDVVLGKLVSRSIGLACAFLVAIPVLVVLIPLGRAQPAAVGRVSLALANTLFFSLSAGLLISSISRKQTRARTGALIVILWSWFIMPEIARWLIKSGIPEALYLPLQLLSLKNTFLWALIPPLGTFGNSFWISLFWTHVLAWGFVILAGLILTRVWQDKACGPAGATWRERFKQWCYGKAGVRSALRARLLNRNPILWLMARDRLKRLWFWVFLTAVAAFGISVVSANPIVLDNPAFPSTLIIFATLIVKLWIGSEAARGFAEEKWAGTLEWLFCTTLTAREIVGGQWLALRWQFFGPIAFLLAAQIGVAVFGLHTDEFSGEEDRRLWIWGCLSYVGTWALDLWALGWTGMWSGMSAKNPRVARGGAAIRIVVIPGLVFSFGMIAQALWTSFGTNSNGPSAWLNLVLWFGLGTVNSLFWGLWSRRQLYKRMRAAVTERFASEDSRGPWWAFLLPKREAASLRVMLHERRLRG
ncbi:MAG: ABC transporter permease subunit [Verrucomicrobia bacterium]|nr:ABC transporter permease subunit [Verrucomicrobiota bacterium]